MADSDVQYLLSLGIDTGLAKPDVDALHASLVKLGRESDQILTRMEKFSGTLTRNSQASDKAGDSLTRTSQATDRLTRSASRADDGLMRLTRRAAALAAGYLTVRRAIGEIVATSRQFGETETALVGVQKTTGLLDDEVASLYDDVVDLAVDAVPQLTSNLLELGQVAGQLGVKGRDNLLAYIETLGQLQAASDVAGEEGARNLTRLLNVQGEGAQNIERTSSALVALGNDAAAAESEILDMATEVGLATAQFRIGSVDALGFGTALKEVGVNAEAGGTSIGRMFRGLQEAISRGGEDLLTWAEVAGVSADELADAWAADSTEAILTVLQGVSRYGQESGLALEALGLNSDRLAKVLPVLAANWQTVTQRIRQSRREADLNTALMIEAARGFDTQESDLRRLANAYSLVQDEIGNGMSPALRELAIDLRDYLVTNREAAQKIGKDLGEAVQSLGRILLTTADNLDVLITAFQVWLGLRILRFLGDVIGRLSRAVAALNVYAVAKGRAVQAEVAHGAAIERTNLWLDLHTQKLWQASSASSAAGKAGTGFLGALRPWVPLLAAVAGGVLLVRRRIDDWGEQMEREVKDIVQHFEDLKQLRKDISEEVQSLADEARMEAEIAKEIRAAGADPESDEAWRIRAQIEAEFHRQQVYAIDELKTKRSELQTKYDEEAEKVGALRSEVNRLREDTQAAIEEANRLLEEIPQGAEFGPQVDAWLAARAKAKGLISQLEGPDVPFLGREGGKADELAEAQVRLNELRILLDDVESNIRSLDQASSDFEPIDLDPEGKLGDLSGDAREAAQEFAQLMGEIRSDTAGLRDLTAAYDEGDEAIRRQNQALELSSRLRSAGIDLTTEQARALGWEQKLREAILEQMQAEADLAGRAMVDSLSRQLEGQRRINDAYAEGTEAVDAARLAVEAEAAARQNAEGVAEDYIDTIRQMTEELFGEQARDRAKAMIDEVENQVEELGRLSEAYTQGASAARATQAELEIERAIRQETAGVIGEERAELEAQIRTREQLAAAVSSQSRLAALREEVDVARELAAVRREDFLTEEQYQRAVAEVNREREVRSQLEALEIDRLREKTALSREAFATESQYVQALAEIDERYRQAAVSAEALIDVRVALEEQDRRTLAALRTAQQAWGHFIESIQRDLAGAFKDVLDDDLDSFADFFDRVLDLGKQFVSEWLAYWTIAGGKKLLDAVTSGSGRGAPSSAGQQAQAAGTGALIDAAAQAGSKLLEGGEGAADSLTASAAETALRFLSGASSAEEALEQGAALGAEQLIGMTLQSGATLITSTEAAGGGFVISATEAGAILIQSAAAAGAELAAGGAAGGATSAAGGAAGGAAAGGAAGGGAAGGAAGAGVIGTVAAAAAVVLIIGAIGYGMGWWGGGGPQEGGATLRQDPFSGQLEIADSWGVNAGVVADKIKGAIKQLDDLVTDMALEIEQFGEVVVEKIEGVYHIAGVHWNALKGATADEIEEAIAVVAIRTADFGDSVSDFLAAVLAGSKAITEEQLRAQVELARMVEGFGRTDLEGDILALGRTMNSIFDELLRLLRDNLEQLGIGLDRTAREEISRWRSLRDEITGRERSDQEILAIKQREAELFNAEKALRVVALQVRAEQLRAEAGLIELKKQLGIDELQFRRQLLNREGQILRAGLVSMGRAVGASAELLGVELAAIEDLIAAIEAIPDIDLSEIRLPGDGADDTAARLADARDRMADLAAEAAGASQQLLGLRQELRSFDQFLEEARRLGAAEEELAQARRDHLTVLSGRFLADLSGANAGPVESLITQFQDAFEVAFELATEQAEAFGTDLTTELDSLMTEVGAVLTDRLGQVLSSEFESLVSSQDVAGMRELAKTVVAFLADLPPELASLADQELARLRGLYRESLLEVRDAVLESVQDYLDVLDGIGATQRRLLSLQEEFQEARDRLAEVDEGLAAEDEIFGPQAAAKEQMEALGDVVHEGFRVIIDDVRSMLGVSGAGEPGGGGPGSTLFVNNVPMPPGGGLVPQGATEGVDELADALDDLAGETFDLAAELRRLEQAERMAAQALAFDFLDSLDDLGVSLPTEVVRELAVAQFELARVQAINAAIALEAAGGFEGLSISLNDLLGLLTGASFELSSFAPRQRSSSGGGGGRGTEDEVARVARELDSQILAWRRLEFGPLTQQALELQRRLHSLTMTAQAAGESTGELDEAYGVALDALVKDALASVDLSDSTLQRQLDDLVERFADVALALELAGASQEQLLEMHDAFSDAWTDFFDQALDGLKRLLEELTASDPRRSGQELFGEAQAEFRDVLVRAQGGDLDAIEDLESVARQYRLQALAFLGEGVYSQEVLDEILAGLQGIVEGDVVPPDIALLEEQLERLRELVAIAQDQPTESSNSGGFDRVLGGIGENRQVLLSNDQKLDAILATLESGRLKVEDVGPALDALLEIAADQDVLVPRFDDVLTALNGVLDVTGDFTAPQIDTMIGILASGIDVKDELSDEQLTAMEDTIDRLLTLTGLSGSQRLTLLDMLSELRAQTTELGVVAANTDPDLYVQPAGVQTLDSGGLITSDGLAFVHTGERVLTRNETRALGQQGVAGGSPTISTAALEASLREVAYQTRRAMEAAERERERMRRRDEAEGQQREKLIALLSQQVEETEGMRGDLKRGRPPAGGVGR